MKKQLKRLVSICCCIAIFVTNLSISRASNENTELGKHGLQGDYYLSDASFTFGTYCGTYYDANIQYSSMETIIKNRTGAADYVAVRWTGRVVAPEDGNYTFSMFSDNGVRLWIGTDLIIDKWVNEFDQDWVANKSIAMKKGEAFDLKLEWFEAIGGSHVTLYWQNDAGITTKVPVPASALYRPATSAAAYVTEIDTSKAELDRGKKDFGGKITLRGGNFDKVDQMEIVNNNGSSLDTPLYPNFTTTNATEGWFELPKDLKAGMYKLRITSTSNGTNYNVLDDNYFYITAAADEVDRSEHPRADWKREQWVSLNGWWKFTFDKDGVGKSNEWYNGKQDVFDKLINVPFPWQSSMSGIGEDSYKGEAWYEREFTLDSSWDGQRVFIIFGGVDWKSSLYVNGRLVGDHVGGQTQFEYDITDYLNTDITEPNRLTLWVEDIASLNKKDYPALIGKQGGVTELGGYTNTSGIWQSVILEGRTCETYFDYVHANPNITDATVQFDIGVINCVEKELTVKYNFISKKWDEIKQKDVETGSSFSGTQTVTVQEDQVSLEPITIPNQQLWDLDNPNLYYGTVELYDGNQLIDSVDTYFGQREVKADFYGDNTEYKYLLINGKPVFMSGVLDQGFWPGGCYTAPSEQALKDDIVNMKERGFNMLRKHIKIEDPVQYYWSDKLGFFIWEDMPYATSMNATVEGGDAGGREVYEYALKNMLKRDYNHPSIVAIILFNETWGIDTPGLKASDGMTTQEWQKAMYDLAKEINPNLPVEDMSPCNGDHIQPTDINSFHFYNSSYDASKSVVERKNNATYIGSQDNFRTGYTQDGDPWFNSEYGGVNISQSLQQGDLDISYCFKYQTDLQRQYPKLNGYVFTQLYDVEYERNGILTYDRRAKEFGYDEIAYGGDMTIADLNQPDYIGVDANPVTIVRKGKQYSAPIVVVNWSGMNTDTAIVKWRFDATDILGNSISTGISGQSNVTYKPYAKETVDVSFKVPDQECVGTLTVWLEVDGKSIAKNFVNVIVNGNKTNSTLSYIGSNSAIMQGKASTALSFSQSGEVTYSYPDSTSFDMDKLESMRIVAEVSSNKGTITVDGITYTSGSQTTVGNECASDLTILVNGVEIDTVYIPDNPRDIRGTLSLLNAKNGGSSADNYGYLLNIRIPDNKLAAVKKAIAANDGEIEVSYMVKSDAENKNGIRMYDNTNGRYKVNPVVIFNPLDDTTTSTTTPDTGNYTAEVSLKDGDSISVRGETYKVSYNGKTIKLTNGSKIIDTATVKEGAHLVAVKLFDDHIRVYVDNDPVPVIDTYDYSEFSSTVVSVSNGSKVVIYGETYTVTKVMPGPASPTADLDGIATVDSQVWKDNFEKDSNWKNALGFTALDKGGVHLRQNSNGAWIRYNYNVNMTSLDELTLRFGNYVSNTNEPLVLSVSGVNGHQFDANSASISINPETGDVKLICNSSEEDYPGNVWRPSTKELKTIISGSKVIQSIGTNVFDISFYVTEDYYNIRITVGSKSVEGRIERSLMDPLKNSTVSKNGAVYLSIGQATNNASFDLDFYGYRHGEASAVVDLTSDLDDVATKETNAFKDNIEADAAWKNSITVTEHTTGGVHIRQNSNGAWIRYNYNVDMITLDELTLRFGNYVSAANEALVLGISGVSSHQFDSNSVSLSLNPTTGDVKLICNGSAESYPTNVWQPSVKELATLITGSEIVKDITKNVFEIRFYESGDSYVVQIMVGDRIVEGSFARSLADPLKNSTVSKDGKVYLSIGHAKNTTTFDLDFYGYKYTEYQMAVWSVEPSLKSEIHLNYKTSVHTALAAGTTPKMTFGSIEVEGILESDGRYSFDFEILPQQMDDEITATLKVQTASGAEKTETKTYSMTQYCRTVLDNEKTTESQKALVVDLMKYGEAAQKQLGLNPTITSGLSAAEKKLGSVETLEGLMNKADAGYVSNPLGNDSNKNLNNSATYKWQSASLVLKDKVVIRFKFTAEDVNGLAVKIQVEGKDAVTYTGMQQIQTTVDEGGQTYYYVDFPVYANEYNKTIKVSFNAENTAELSYSVNTYLYNKKDLSDWSSLLSALNCYGWSAIACK